MSMSKARFDSSAKPLSRLILLYEAVIITAQHILHNRHGAEAKQAEWFLRLITEEHLLQMAMLSDAMDEALTHIRVCDSEEVDTRACPLRPTGS